MKKNFTINLAGQIFSIDEDAYNLLLNYTESLRRYYRHQEEGEEVVDDIEDRIAELFLELQARGYKAITIEHVQDVIQRIGNVEDLTDNGARMNNGKHAADEALQHAADAAKTAADGIRSTWNDMRSGKRFYRDSEKRILAGVLAGLANYFGGDVVIWRIVYLIIVLVPVPLIGDAFGGIMGTFVILYIIIAFVAPAASTPEDHLQMRGETVNPQNIAEELNRENTMYASNTVAARAQRRHAIGVIFAILLLVFSAWMWLALVGVLCGAGAIWMMPEMFMDDVMEKLPNIPLADIRNASNSILYVLAAVGSCLFIMAYCSLHTGLSFFEKVKAMGLKERLLWLVLWIVSVVAITMTGVNCAGTMRDLERQYDATHIVDYDDFDEDFDEDFDTVTDTIVTDDDDSMEVK